jgi:DNA-binding response OmpR family regulator
MAKILLIEDNPANADMIIRILESANHTVRHSLRGLEGAQMARREIPDMILMDFDLPDVDGRTMAIVLRKQLGGVNAPPIVAVTARGGDTEKRIAQQLGFSAFVSKPFTPEELLAAIEALLKRSHPTG